MTDRLAIRLTDEGSIVWKDDGNVIDLEMVEDDEELTQALRIRMRTVQGEDMWFQGFGLPIFTIILENVSSELLGNMVRTQLEEEDGVKEVRDVEVVSTEDERRDGIVRVNTSVIPDSDHELQVEALLR